jgi:hypothetical protein
LAFEEATRMNHDHGERDVPGHEWIQVSDNRLYGRHLNTGPESNAKWWSSDAPDGALLFTVEGIIDTWSESKAEDYASQGFVHYHELVDKMNGKLNSTKVLWLKHAAVSEFAFDGGPPIDLPLREEGDRLCPIVLFQFSSFPSRP